MQNVFWYQNSLCRCFTVYRVLLCNVSIANLTNKFSMKLLWLIHMFKAVISSIQ